MPSSENQVVVCEICCKFFKRKEYMVKHVKFVHGGEDSMRFACPFCEKGFKRKHCMKRHMRLVHHVVYPNISEALEMRDITVEVYKTVNAILDVLEIDETKDVSEVIQSYQDLIAVEMKEIAAINKRVEAMQDLSKTAEMAELSVAANEIIHVMQDLSATSEMREVSIATNELVQSMQMQDRPEVVEVELISLSNNEAGDAMQFVSQVVEIEKVSGSTNGIVCAKPVESKTAKRKKKSAKNETRIRNAPMYPCLEEECHGLCKSRQELREHLAAIHGKEFNIIELKFSSVNEFMEWKLSFEYENQIYFPQLNGMTRKKNYDYQYFHCFRSGFYRHKGKGIRKSKISRKSNIMCTAEIKIIIAKDGTVSAKVCNDHYGHENSLSLLHLTSAEKNRIANLLKTKTDISTILKYLKADMIASGRKERIHLTTRQDVKNIERSFRLNSDSYINDATNETEDPMSDHMNDATNETDFDFQDPLQVTKELLAEIKENIKKFDPVDNQAMFVEVNSMLRKVANYMKVESEQNKQSSSTNSSKNSPVQESFFSKTKKPLTRRRKLQFEKENEIRNIFNTPNR